MKNLDEHTITAETLRRIAPSTDPRLHEIMRGLITHLHAFAREVKLSESEWMAGVQYLTRTGQLSGDVRQEMILLSDTLGLSQLVVAQNHSRGERMTEQTVFGPFHVEGAPRKNSHGSVISGAKEGADLFVDALVVDGEGSPVDRAVVDVWQADAEGFYDVQDANWALKNANLRAVLETDNEGRISFRSIMPKSYPIPMDGTVGEMMNATGRSPMRPAHLHFMIKKAGFDTLVTHVFVDGDDYLDTDAVFGVRSSCIGNYVRHEEGLRPDGRVADAPFYTLDYVMTLDQKH